MNKTYRKWTEEEEAVMLRYIKAGCSNMHKCFFMISEHLTDAGTPRTPGAVGNHWYTVLSKKDDKKSFCFFTASSRHIAKNRKNGTGVPTTPSMWQRFMRIIFPGK